MKWVCPSNGTEFVISRVSDSLRHRFRIIRVNGEIETHVVDISCWAPEENYVVATLDKGDVVEEIFNLGENNYAKRN